MFNLGGTTNDYSLYINGEKCSNVGYMKCPDGSDTWLIDCQNLVEGAFVDTCKNLNIGGLLEVFTLSLEQSDCRPPLARCYFFDMTCTA
jgi:hypothetical protein